MVIIDLGLRGRYVVNTNEEPAISGNKFDGGDPGNIQYSVNPGNIDPTPTPTRLQVLATIGRTVHYVARGSADGVYPPVCRAAIVTEVDPEDPVGATLLLCVLNPTGIFFSRVGYDPAGEPGTWHWPEQP